MYKIPSISKVIGLSVLLLASGNSVAGQTTWQELGIMEGFPPAADQQVTSKNWVTYPYNRWAMQNVRAVLPTVEIKAGPATPWEMGAQRDFMSMSATNLEGEKVTAEDILNSHNTDAFLVVHKGEIIQEKYWNGMTQESRHWLASMTKSYTGLATEMLIEQGVLDRHTRAEEYVDSLKGTALGGATIEQLIDMTAGNAWDESFEALMDPTSLARAYGNAVGTWPMGQESNGVFGILPEIRQDREHGTSFVYNTPHVDTMGWVISSVTGKRLEDVYTELFMNDLGAEHNPYMMVDTNTYAWATGGVNKSARDAARFGQMMASRGEFNGKRIFPESIMENITNGDADTFATSSYGDRIPGGAYSSYFWLLNDGDGAFMAKGLYAQYIYMNPAKDVVIVRFATPEISGSQKYDVEMVKLFKSIADTFE